ncbi:unnamed protein product [Urochloa humidicola]
MDFGFYKRASRGIKHKAAATAMPFYPRKPAQVAPAAAPAQKAKQPVTSTVWSVPTPPPSSTVVAMEVGSGGNGVAPSSGAAGGSSDADVDRLAALYISRVQERLRREHMADDWRMYY